MGPQNEVLIRISYSKYTTVAARATRQALKETERAEAERRAYQALRYQEWTNGEASDHVRALYDLPDRSTLARSRSNVLDPAI